MLQAQVPQNQGGPQNPSLSRFFERQGSHSTATVWFKLFLAASLSPYCTVLYCTVRYCAVQYRPYFYGDSLATSCRSRRRARHRALCASCCELLAVAAAVDLLVRALLYPHHRRDDTRTPSNPPRDCTRPHFCLTTSLEQRQVQIQGVTLEGAQNGCSIVSLFFRMLFYLVCRATGNCFYSTGTWSLPPCQCPQASINLCRC